MRRWCQRGEMLFCVGYVSVTVLEVVMGLGSGMLTVVVDTAWVKRYIRCSCRLLIGKRWNDKLCKSDFQMNMEQSESLSIAVENLDPLAISWHASMRYGLFRRMILSPIVLRLVVLCLVVLWLVVLGLCELCGIIKRSGEWAGCFDFHISGTTEIEVS